MRRGGALFRVLRKGTFRSIQGLPGTGQGKAADSIDAPGIFPALPPVFPPVLPARRIRLDVRAQFC